MMHKKGDIDIHVSATIFTVPKFGFQLMGLNCTYTCGLHWSSTPVTVGNFYPHTSLFLRPTSSHSVHCAWGQWYFCLVCL